MALLLRSLLWLVLLLPFGVQAQMLDNSTCAVFTELPYFSEVFMKTNQVKNIHGVLTTKATMDRMRDGNKVYDFRFDTNGRLMHQASSRMKNGVPIDTAVTSYAQDADGNMLTLRKNDAHGFYSYEYSYDESGKRIGQTYYRDKNAGPSKFKFKQGKRFVISSETYTWETISPQEEKCKFFNNYGKVFMERYIRYDEYGYMVEVADRYVRTSRKIVVLFEYNERGMVSKRTETSTIGKGSVVRKEFKYDEVGNLLEIDFYRDEKHITHKELLYNESMLLSATIEKDVASNFLTIVKYTYTFFD